MYVSKGFVNLINDQTDRILPNKYVISYYRFKINNKYVVCNWARERAERAKRPSILSVIRANHSDHHYIPHENCVLLGNVCTTQKRSNSIFTIRISIRVVYF